MKQIFVKGTRCEGMKKMCAPNSLICLLLSLFLLLSCTSAPPTSSPEPRPATGIAILPNLLEAAGPKQPGSFKTQATPSYGVPACAQPSTSLSSHDVKYRYWYTTIRGHTSTIPGNDPETGDIRYKSFARASLDLRKDPASGALRVHQLKFDSNDGDHWDVYGAKGVIPTFTSFDTGFTQTFSGEQVGFLYSNNYGSVSYGGGQATLTYSPFGRILTVQLSGRGNFKGGVDVYQGGAEFIGSAQFLVNLPEETFGLTTEGVADIDLGTSATLRVTGDYCQTGWNLKIAGQALAPDLAGGYQCDKTYSGGGNQTLSWEVKCDDGRWMRPGTYTATLTSGGTPPLTATVSVPVASNGVMPTPSPTATPSCSPSDPSCPLQCPPGEICPQPTQTPQSPGPTNTPSPGETPSPGPTVTPGPTPTATPPSPTPSPTSTPGPTPTPPEPTATPSGSGENCADKKNPENRRKCECREALKQVKENYKDYNGVFGFAGCDKNDTTDEIDESSFRVQGAVEPVRYLSPPGSETRLIQEPYLYFNGGDKPKPVLVKVYKGAVDIKTLEVTAAAPTSFVGGTVTWDGTDNYGRVVANGNYTLKTSAKAKRVVHVTVQCSGFYNKAIS